MKIITLNTHSIIEQDYERKLSDFADMIKIEKPENGNVQNIEEHFTYDDVEYYDLSIIDEAQKEKEVAEIMNQSLFSLFDGFKINGMTLGQKIWASIIMVAIFA